MIATNLQQIKETIHLTAIKSGRTPTDIKLIAVSKRFSADKIQEAYQAGHELFGENYIQEVAVKKPLIPKEAKIHFIGNLQSNKAKVAAECCDMIETVDREKLGRALDKHCAKIGKKLDILVQVNIGNDPNKSGIEKDLAASLITKLNEMPNLRVCGLMTIPPLTNSAEESRLYFRELRILSEELNNQGLFPDSKKVELSMGMSGDFNVAIEEGATIIRIGTAIFGQRS